MSATAESNVLPPFLLACVEKGVLAQSDAELVDRFRRSSGTGLTRAIVGSDLDDETVGAMAGLTTPHQGSYMPLLLLQAPDPQLTFDAMVPFEVNALAQRIAHAVASDGDSCCRYNPLLVHSELGLGKTHLLSAIANAVSDGRARLVNVADLDAEHERASRLGQRASMRYWLCDSEMLLLDDIQLCQGKEDLQREIFALINQMTQQGKLVVLSSSVAAGDLEIDPQLESRITSGLVVTLRLGSRREREATVRRFLHQSTVPDAVIRYLAQHVTDNVRRLRAAATQLAAMQESLGVEITVELARAVAPQPEDLHAPSPPSPEDGLDSEEQIDDPAASAGGGAAVDRFKKMLASAESEEEQVLALQIAIGERVRQMREKGGDAQVMHRFEHALELLRDGDIKEAIRCVGGAI